MREDSLIKNIDYMTQCFDFTDCQNGKMHPSDIDAALEFNDEYLILIEAKHALNMGGLPLGQRLLLERISDAWKESKKDSILYYVEHDSEERTIEFLDSIVIHIYYNGHWRTPKIKERISLKEELLRMAVMWDEPKLRGMLK